MSTVQLKQGEEMTNTLFTRNTKLGVACMDFSPEHELLVVATNSGNITFINVKNCTILKVWNNYHFRTDKATVANFQIFAGHSVQRRSSGCFTTDSAPRAANSGKFYNLQPQRWRLNRS